MKKTKICLKTLLAFLLLASQILLLGCSKKPSELSLYDETKACKDIIAKIPEDTISNIGVDVSFSYSGDMRCLIEDSYYVEIYDNSNWYNIDEGNYVFKSIGYILESNVPFTMKYDWKNRYGVLSRGTYRIIIPVSLNGTSSFIAVPFSI